MPFDKDTGVVYSETFIRLHKCPDAHNHRLPRVGPSSLKHARGSRSLVDMVRSTFVRNFQNCDPAALAALPQAIAENLWAWLACNGADVLSAWKVFAASGHFGQSFTEACTIRCIRQTCLSNVVLRADMAWLVDLTVGGESLVANSDILSLIPRMCNLRSFHLQANARPSRETRSVLTDRALRAWAADAVERGALPKLEMIVVDEQVHITTDILQHLGGFPSLDTFATRKCGINVYGSRSLRETIDRSRQAGWHAGAATSMHQFIVTKLNESPMGGAWPTLVRLWTAIRPSQHNLPVLSVLACLRQDLCSMRLLENTWCFERDWNHKLIELGKEKSDEPPVRKRRKVSSLAASPDMMSGIF